MLDSIKNLGIKIIIRKSLGMDIVERLMR